MNSCGSDTECGIEYDMAMYTLPEKQVVQYIPRSLLNEDDDTIKRHPAFRLTLEDMNRFRTEMVNKPVLWSHKHDIQLTNLRRVYMNVLDELIGSLVITPKIGARIQNEFGVIDMNNLEGSIGYTVNLYVEPDKPDQYRVGEKNGEELSLCHAGFQPACTPIKKQTYVGNSKIENNYSDKNKNTIIYKCFNIKIFNKIEIRKSNKMSQPIQNTQNTQPVVQQQAPISLLKTEINIKNQLDQLPEPIKKRELKRIENKTKRYRSFVEEFANEQFKNKKNSTEISDWINNSLKGIESAIVNNESNLFDIGYNLLSEKNKLKVDNEKYKTEYEKTKLETEKLKVDNEKIKLENEKVKSDHQKTLKDIDDKNKKITDLEKDITTLNNDKQALLNKIKQYDDLRTKEQTPQAPVDVNNSIKGQFQLNNAVPINNQKDIKHFFEELCGPTRQPKIKSINNQKTKKKL